MIVSARNKIFQRKFQFGRGNIWTTVSSILNKLLGKVTSNAMKETVKSIAKKTAQDIGKQALQQAGSKGAQLAKDKFSNCWLLNQTRNRKLKHNLTKFWHLIHLMDTGRVWETL